jgi:dihydrolipoamide dehydrogenase
MNNRYDLLVIGSGPAGHSAALRASSYGLKVAIIEKNPGMTGGICLNEGCIPVKSLLHAAGIYSYISENPGMFGVSCTSGVDIESFVKAGIKAKERLKKGLIFLFEKNRVDVFYGTAVLKSSSTVRITAPGGERKTLSGKNLIVATGSSPRSLPDLEYDGKFILNSSHVMNIDEIPEKILIIGAGAIGVEFCSFFNSIGAKVTLAEAAASILPFEDRELTKKMFSLLRKSGIEIVTRVSSLKAAMKDDMVEMEIFARGENKKMKFNKILVAVGRGPNTSGIGLEQAGVALDNKGFIRVDDRFMTSAPGIYAAGDVINTPMLAHAASAEGEHIVDTLIGNHSGIPDYNNIPSAVYSKVELASVGFTEEQCRKMDIDLIVAKQFFLSNGRAVAADESEGFIKIIVSKDDGLILGAHILGHKASELIHEFVIARKYGLKAKDIGGTVHAHPTFSETVMQVCRAV